MTATLIHQTHIPFQVELYRLDSGLHVIYHPDHNAPLLSYQTWVNVGSRHEPQGHTGLAHLFEHLMFKATQTHAEGIFDRKIEGMGGNVNAATWLDWTYFYNDVPSRFLDEVIALEADRFENLLLNETQLETERKVVMNERRECVDDDPEAFLDEQLWALAFGIDHPYGHPTIGWMKDIETLSLEHCRAFYQNYYHPQYLTIVVSGDVSRDHLLNQIEQTYRFTSKNIDSSFPSPPPFIAPQLQGPLHRQWTLDLHLPKMILGWIMPSVLDQSSMSLEVLNELLFDGDSSRLHRILVDQLEWVNQVYGWVPSFYSDGLYTVQVEVRTGIDLNQVKEHIFKGIQKIADEGIDEAELNKAKTRLELELYREMQTLQQRAYALGFWQNVAGCYDEMFKRPNALRAVSVETLQNVAQLLLESNRQISVYGLPSESSVEVE